MLARLHRSRLIPSSLVLLVALAFPVATASAAGSSRVAMVVGNGFYQSKKNFPALPNARKDAEDIARALAAIKFDVIEITDGDRGHMREALGDFAKRLLNAEFGLFYYAGHGLQVGGKNLLLPTDFVPDEDKALQGSVLLDNVINILDGRNLAASLIVVDACRDNPLAWKMGDVRGLSRVERKAGMRSAIMFSAAPGQVAFDGQEGGNSPFATFMLTELGTPNASLHIAMTNVMQNVWLATRDAPGGPQVPWYSPSKDFALSAPADAAPATEASEWQRIIASAKDDPGKLQDLQRFLSAFPHGAFHEKAEQQRRTLTLALLDTPASSIPANPRPIRIMWVDDKPNNNISERKALHRLGLRFGVDIMFDTKLDTASAIAAHSSRPYDMIISDAGRNEDAGGHFQKDLPMKRDAGYALLIHLRDQMKDIATPFFIYASGANDDYLAKAYALNGQGNTGHPLELFASILAHLN